MRRLRVEQYNRYFAQAGEDYSTTMDDTIPEEEEEAAPVDTGHRNYDEQVLFSFIWTERGEGRWAEGYDPITPCPGASVVRSASQMEETPPGTHFLASVKHVPGCKRRVQTRLGVVREIPLLGRGV